ncbi:MAG: hypothetical protein AB9856_02825 [Cellulosilyticaceae bacterium]
MEKHSFQFNRYKSEHFLGEWEIIDKSGNVITINGVEIEGVQQETELLMQKFILQITDTDNEIQMFCKKNFENGKFAIQNYIVALEWISMEHNFIEMGYWGEYVNIELRAICKFENDKWKLEDIYYQ